MSETEIVREGVVAIIERAGRYLTITRSQSVIAPGKICFPGGGIEADGMPQQALIRECFEELGVLVEPIRQLGISVTPWGVRLQWFSARLSNEDETFRPNPQEVSAVTWMTRDEMLTHSNTLEGNDSFFERFETMLQRW
jgi:8-oxo-dGTP pyrophosphatase MutT (NUDIX family)